MKNRSNYLTPPKRLFGINYHYWSVVTPRKTTNHSAGLWKPLWCISLHTCVYIISNLHILVYSEHSKLGQGVWFFWIEEPWMEKGRIQNLIFMTVFIAWGALYRFHKIVYCVILSLHLLDWIQIQTRNTHSTKCVKEKECVIKESDISIFYCVPPWS